MGTSRLISQLAGATGAGSRFSGEKLYGVYEGVVTANEHPEGRYEVKVKLPNYFPDQESWWCRIVTGMSGGERGGHYFLPEVGDEVIIAFVNGDPNNPIVVGAVWGGTDKFPQKVKVTPNDVELPIPNSEQGGQNNYRFFQSRSGHVLMYSDEEGKELVSLRTKAGHELVLNDTGGEEKIQLYDKDNKQWMEVDVPGKKITIQTDTGELYVKAKTKITMECEDFILKASKSIKTESGTTTEHKAGSSWKQESGSTMDLKAGGTMTQKAPLIKLN